MSEAAAQTLDAVLRGSDALIIVDVQRDFLPGGSLPVRDGERIVAPLNDYLRLFQRHRLPIFATRDWHPADHFSFRERGGAWPVHCVAATDGAKFAAELKLPPDTRIISKGTQRDTDAYSGFQQTGLASALRERGCRRVFIGGLATDYCVKATARDALSEGFDVIVLSDAVQAIDLKPGDGQSALSDLVARGACLIDARGKYA